jgi:murein DD-endopeptidase MepM/ murein hydrolase activator NlpD
MAEPAWALRAQRTRKRRKRSRSATLFWPQRNPIVADRLRRFLPGWLAVRFLGPLWQLLALLQTPNIARATRRARATLDGIPTSELERWPWPAASRYSGASTIHPAITSQLVLRYAGHIIAVGVVMLVVFASDASSWAGEMRLDVGQARTVRLADVDPVVRWALPSNTQLGHEELAQPVVRAPQPQFDPAFVATHEVVEGETLGELASRYRVSVASLFWANDLERGDVLAAGQEMRIPRLSGVPHVIQPGETLESLAEAFQVSASAIILMRSNGIREDMPLPEGREIFVPGGTQPYPAEILTRYGDEQGIAALAAVAAGVVREPDTNLRTGPGRAYPRVGYLDAGRRLKLIARHGDWAKVESGDSGAGWVRADLLGLSEARFNNLPETNDFPPPPPFWVWPTRGEITSRFGWRSMPYRSFHDGLDIANAAGTRIYAARAGHVIEAGWCSGFGYCVKLDHGDGVVTIYGHMLKKPPVAVGESVDVGALIGYMGSTYDRSGGGYSTGVHLHFTVKVNGKAVNPLKFLP